MHNDALDILASDQMQWLCKVVKVTVSFLPLRVSDDGFLLDFLEHYQKQNICYLPYHHFVMNANETMRLQGVECLYVCFS